MIRIRGTLGPWPVDLNIEMSADQWQQLAAVVKVETPAAATRPASAGDDAHWVGALRLVEHAGEMSGPVLMAQLEGLAGSPAAAKRLLVRLRHCAQVNIRTEADAPVYCWVG